MTVLHTGSTKKFSTNWQSIFGAGAKKPADAKKPAGKSKKPAKAAVSKGAKSAKKKTKK